MKLIGKIIALAVAVNLWSCSGGSQAQQKVLSEFIGTEIAIPAELNFEVRGTAVNARSTDPDFTIIAYLDSAGCTTCRMKLPIWQALVNSLKSEDIEVDFLMILNTAKNRDMTFTIERDGFQHPIAFDKDGLFSKANNLPDDNAFHTFLLDSDSHVIAAGNPALNPKIRDIYHRMMRGDKTRPTNKTRLCSEPHIAMGAVAAGDTVIKRFQLINTTDTTLSLQEIVPSCDCTVTHIDRDTIRTGEKALVTVTYIADSTASPVSRTIDLFFNELPLPERLSLNGYTTN